MGQMVPQIRGPSRAAGGRPGQRVQGDMDGPVPERVEVDLEALPVEQSDGLGELGRVDEQAPPVRAPGGWPAYGSVMAAVASRTRHPP